MQRTIRRSVSLSIPVLILAIMLNFWPGSSNAARSIVVLADGNKAWSAGRFFRTGLALDKPSGPGGVRLVPAKVQKQYTQTSALPIPLSSHAGVTYRNRIFVMGGDTLDNGQLVKSNKVFTTRRTPNSNNGELEPWQGAPVVADMPVALADMAAVVVTVDGKPFIVALGGIRGRTTVTGGDLTTYTTSQIYYYPIAMDNNGVLGAPQAWQSANRRLPYQPDYDDPVFEGTGLAGGGARDIAAVAVDVNGESYIYLFGGRQRYFNGASEVNHVYSNIFRARVRSDGANGITFDEWEYTTTDGPSPTVQHIEDGNGQPVPLADAATVSYTDPISGDTAVYLIGGVTSESTYQQTANVYIAKINGRTGAINWLNLGGMSESRSAHAAVESDGTITVSGGRAVNGSALEATPSMALGYIEPDLNLYRSEPNAPNFDVTTGGFLYSRALHTMNVIDGGQYDDFAYIIGGEVTSGQAGIPATAQVIFGNLDEPPQESDSLISSGKYYSPLYDFGVNAKYHSIRWKAILPADATFSQNPIRMQYRVGNDPFNLGEPIDINVVTTDGSNNVFAFPAPGGQPLTGRFIQFIATLNAADGALRSPILDDVLLDVEREGFPNVVVGQSSITVSPNSVDNRFTPAVTISNTPFSKTVNGQTQLVPALPANWDGEGYLYVDMYISYAGPLGQPGPEPARPALGTAGDVYAVVNKASLPVEAIYAIPASTTPQFHGWRPASCKAWPCPAVNWNSMFPFKGEYYVWIMVDSVDPDSINDPKLSQEQRDRLRQFGNVVEADASGADAEANNWLLLRVTVDTDVPRVLLPLIGRITTTTGGASVQEVLPLPREQLTR
jgi:hypothetical protein